MPVGVVAEELQQYALVLGRISTTAGHAQAATVRLYSDTDSAAHVIGYMGSIPPDQVADFQARGYGGDEMVGIAGLEAWGERSIWAANAAAS